MLDKANLKAAAEAISAETLIAGEWDELVQTRDTLADFIAARGNPDYVSEAENGVIVYEWRLGSKTLAVVDCGDARACLHM